MSAFINRSALALLLAAAGTANAQINRPAHEARVRAVMSDPFELTVSGNGTGDPTQGVCPSTYITNNTAHDFNALNPSVVVQAGFAENELAASTYVLSADDFPIIVEEAWILFGTFGTTVTTTTEWTVQYWEGTPASGNLVAQFSSDDVILPHLTIPPGSNGVYVVVQGDTEEPIVLQNNGSNQFTIAFRIDSHNNQTSNPCLTAPPSASNAFPTTDVNGLQFPTQNWLFGVDCGSFGCPPNGGWATFQQLASFCTPSGDWIMRALWRSIDCSELAGACCLTDGSCAIVTGSSCLDSGGIYQGDGVTCVGVSCPDPTGACCFPDLSCLEDIEESNCVNADGQWLGANTDCTGDPCALGPGACCVPSTGGCLELDPDDCALVQGIYQGEGLACSSIVCFPMGACCLPDGSCEDGGGVGISPEDCAALGGTFQGDGLLCATIPPCPLPTGACCVPLGCLVLSEDDCGVVGGSWGGGGTDCEDGDGSGNADVCEACPADLDDSGAIDFGDLLAILAAWGPCGDPCPEDLDESNAVDFGDVLEVLAGWGPC